LWPCIKSSSDVLYIRLMWGSRQLLVTTNRLVLVNPGTLVCWTAVTCVANQQQPDHVCVNTNTALCLVHFRCRTVNRWKMVQMKHTRWEGPLFYCNNIECGSPVSITVTGWPIIWWLAAWLHLCEGDLQRICSMLSITKKMYTADHTDKHFSTELFS